MYNTTADAHPMHIHEVIFEVVNREGCARVVRTIADSALTGTSPVRRSPGKQA